MLQGRCFRTHLAKLHPNLADRIHDKQQKRLEEASGTIRSFNIGDEVWYSDAPYKEGWWSAVVASKVGQVIYDLKLPEGNNIRRHVDHIKARFDSKKSDKAQDTQIIPEQKSQKSTVWFDLPKYPQVLQEARVGPQPVVETHQFPVPEVQTPTRTGTVVAPRRSTRQTHPPQRLDL